MAETRLVNVYHKVPYDVIVGRTDQPFHFGNPFSHLGKSLAAVKVDSREEAIARFEGWLYGDSDQDVEPERRKWVVQHLMDLEGKVLACYCSPKSCHGDVIVRWIVERRKRLDSLAALAQEAQDMGLYDDHQPYEF